MAPTAVSTFPKAVTTTTGTPGRLSIARRQNSSPSIPCICRSVTIASNSEFASVAMASAPLPKQTTSKPRFTSAEPTTSRMAASSSTNSTLLSMQSPICFWKMDAEGRPLSRLAGNRDPSVVLLGDPLGDGEAEPGAFFGALRRKEGFEDSRQRLFRDSHTVIDDFDARVRLLGTSRVALMHAPLVAHADGQDAAAHRLCSIDHEIQYDLKEPVPIALYSHRRSGHVESSRHVSLFRSLSRESDGASHDVDDVDALFLPGPAPGKRKHFTDDPRHPLRLLDDDGRIAMRIARRTRRLGSNHLSTKLDHVEGVAELV